jgi:MFS family permease
MTPTGGPPDQNLDRATRTYNRDRIRGACNGVLETSLQVFGLLVIIREFHAPGTVKSLLVAAHPFGLLLTPLTLFWFGRMGWPASATVAGNYGFAAVALALAVLTPSPILFFIGTAAAAMVLAQQMPLMVHIYTENYAHSRRGRLLSTSIVLSVLVSTVFSLVGGAILDIDLQNYRWLFAFAALAAMAAGLAVRGIPSSPISPTGGRNPLVSLRFAWQDRVFGAMLVVWMLMGLGNLIILPLRIEYMANSAYGINATNAQIALATAVIPSLVRVFSTHFWGHLFDRYDFFFIRMALNAIALTAILLFFSTHSIWMLYLAGALFGFAVAGANIAWSLWVTKFAPAGKTAEYMSVHTFATGIRGTAAPFIGFATIVALSPLSTALISSALIVTSIVLLIPLRSWALRGERF